MLNSTSNLLFFSHSPCDLNNQSTFSSFHTRLCLLCHIAGHGGGYYLPRAQRKPSRALQRKVFPWLEYWEIRLNERAKRRNFKEGGLDEDDIAAQGFISLLKELRIIFLHDSAVLRKEYPSLPFFSDPLFSPKYCEFAVEVQHSMVNTDVPRSVLFERLVPELR